MQSVGGVPTAKGFSKPLFLTLPAGCSPIFPLFPYSHPPGSSNAGTHGTFLHFQPDLPGHSGQSHSHCLSFARAGSGYGAGWGSVGDSGPIEMRIMRPVPNQANKYTIVFAEKLTVKHDSFVNVTSGSRCAPLYSDRRIARIRLHSPVYYTSSCRCG